MTKIFTIAALMLATAVAVKAQTPPPHDIMPSGELYDIRNRPIVYIDFSRKPGQRATRLLGHVARYTVLDERTTDYPAASIWFLPDDGRGGILVNLAYPININGMTYKCANSSSRFTSRFHVCATLPNGIMGPKHHVAIDAYLVKYQDGYVGMATDMITSQ